MTRFIVHSEQDESGWFWWAEAEPQPKVFATAGDESLAECRRLVREMCEMEGWSAPVYELAGQPNHYQIDVA